MAINLTRMTANVNNIQALSDRPNQTDGLTADGLKARYDKAGSDIKTFINTTMLPEIEQVLNLLYPIGRGFIDFTETDYSNYLGFTWERELVGMTPVGLDISDSDFNEVGKTGGEKTHTLIVDEMPPHNHQYGKYLDWYTKGGATGIVGPGNNISTATAGSGEPHNNLQPYQVVSYWKRVS